MSKKYRNPVRWASAVCFAGMAIGAGIGVNAAGEDQAADIRRLQIARGAAEAIGGQIEEANRNVARIEQSLGETCLAVIRHYQPGGRLGSVPEDSAVNDLVSLPNKPCGDTQPAARLALRDFNGAHQIVDQALHDRGALQVSMAQAEKSVEDSNLPAGIMQGSAIGLFLGILGGFGTAINVELRNIRDGHS